MIDTTNPNWDDLKVRCSSIHSVLADSRSNPCLTDLQKVEIRDLRDKQEKKPLTAIQAEKLAELALKEANGSKIILSDTCITYLLEEYAWRTEQMVRVTKEILDVPQMQKGTFVEKDSLTLLSFVDDVLYKENRNENEERERVYNDYLSGEVDAYEGESIMTATTIPDIKSIWDYPTFLCKTQSKLLPANDWQIKGYQNISGAKSGFVANCLINTPPHVIEKVKWRLLSKLDVATDENPEFKRKWAMIERSMIFDHIPPHKRVFKQPVEPMTKDQEQKLYDRVKVCREWLWNFDETMKNLNKRFVQNCQL